MDVSVIVLAWNAKALTRECLRSVYAHTHGIEFEVIVVDNASTDETAAMVTRGFPQARLVRLEQNLGFARGNNAGIAVSAGRYVLLLNNDTQLVDNALAQAVAFLDAHPNAAVMGCRCLGTDGKVQQTFGRTPTWLSEFLLFSVFIIKWFPNPVSDCQRMRLTNVSSARMVEFVSGTFFAVRRDTFDIAGLLAADFFMYYEDAEYCSRVNRQQGLDVYYVPDISILHLGSASFGGDNLSQARIAFRSVQRYLAATRSPAVARFFRLAVLAAWVLDWLLLNVVDLVSLGKIERVRRKARLIQGLLRQPEQPAPWDKD